MSNQDRADPASGGGQTGASSEAAPPRIGSPPRRKSYETIPVLPPLDPAPPDPAPPEPVPPAPSPSVLSLAPPRRAAGPPTSRPARIDPRAEVDDGPSAVGSIESIPQQPPLRDPPGISLAPPRAPGSPTVPPRPSRPPPPMARRPSQPSAPAVAHTRAPPPRQPRAPFVTDPLAQSSRAPAPRPTAAPSVPSPAAEVFSVAPPPPTPASTRAAARADPLQAASPNLAARRVTAAPKSLARVAPAAGDSTYASLPPLRLSATPGDAAAAPGAEGDGETALQGSERALAAHKCMLALARASRSYLIYDPSNQAVRGFLDAVRGAFADYLSRYGEMPLAVRPFELVLDHEVVYIERERERSLALKLFRDGVRKITLDADTTWQELTKLLEILSIRFVGVRHDEDDLVTLLWKAGFHNINIESIEGFVPDDDDEMPAGERGASVGVAIEASAKIPADFDLPAPSLPLAARVSPAEVSDEARAALVAECASPRLPQVTIDLIRQLLAVAGDPTDPVGFDEVAPLVREARDFLLSDSRLQQLLALYDVLARFDDTHPDLAEQVGPLVSGFFDVRALQKLVRSVPHDAPGAPRELKDLLSSLPYDPLPVLLDLLGTERAENDRRILRELLEGFLPARADVVVARLRSVRGSLAADLLRALAERLPDAPSLVASTLIGGEDDELQMEFLRLTATARTDASTRGVLVHLLRSPSELLRVRTVEAIGEHREPGAFTLLQRHAEHRAEERSSPEEMTAVGRAMTLVDGGRAIEAFREWAKPAGILQRLMKNDAHGARMRAAAAGLARHPADEADAILREMMAAASTEAMRRMVEDARAERAQVMAVSA
jgi:hypothetical protein